MLKKYALTMALVAACAFSAACGNAKNDNAQVTNDTNVVVENESVAEINSETSVEETAEETVEETEAPLEDGVYSAKFEPDSSMFRVNETCDDRGILTVENGQMTLHITMRSENIVNLYLGLVKDAQNSDELIEPTKEEVTYSDGSTETVNAFDVPVPYLDKEFDLALIGKKGVWYDHKVVVTDVEPAE